MLRICLKDKSSVLVDEKITDLLSQLNLNDFVMVTNNKTKKKEIYNKDYIWCVRISSQE